jgi:endonuclease/exonuclease/phosphatase (EEP) superfamily protein YafD
MSPVRQTRPPTADPVQLLRRALVGAGLGYAGAILGYSLLRPLLGTREGWIELADDLEPWAFLPVPVIGALAAVTGSSSLAAASAAMAGTFGLRWGHRYLRSGSSSARRSSDLTIMTFNTLAWQREGHDLEASILSASPDIVGLQEIGPRAAEHLATTLADRFPYHYVTPSPSPNGATVLSRYPLRDAVAFRASERGHWWQRMLIDTPNGPITYFNIHTKIPYVKATHWRIGKRHIPLEFHAQRRRREVEKLVAMIDKTEGPVIVVGDFNMTERSPDYRLVATRLRDAYRAVGNGLGHTFPRAGAWPRMFPTPWPTLRLDYVWHSPQFESTWAYRGDAGHSDHHPVVVGLRWATSASHLVGSVPIAASAV